MALHIAREVGECGLNAVGALGPYPTIYFAPVPTEMTQWAMLPGQGYKCPHCYVP